MPRVCHIIKGNIYCAYHSLQQRCFLLFLSGITFLYFCFGEKHFWNTSLLSGNWNVGLLKCVFHKTHIYRTEIQRCALCALCNTVQWEALRPAAQTVERYRGSDSPVASSFRLTNFTFGGQANTDYVQTSIRPFILKLHCILTFFSPVLFKHFTDVWFLPKKINRFIGLYSFKESPDVLKLHCLAQE